MKLAIIGAGPGGLYAALTAARKNVRVDLFEKRGVGEGIVCGECIFDSLGIMSRPGRGLLHPVDEMEIKGRGRYTFALGRHRSLWMLDRKTWQRDLARRAQGLGAVFHANIRITQERLRSMRKEYDWIIDASGAPSVTSRLYQFTDEYFREYLVAYQVVLASDFSALLPRITVAFFPDVPAEFQPAYFWIFPKDEKTANVGVVCSARGVPAGERLDLKKLLADVMRDEGLDNATVLERGGGIAASRMLPRLIYDNILLVGDAAGLTSALHGGGIDMACLSGTLAADAMIGGPKDIAAYEEKLRMYMQEKLALEKVTISKMRTLSFDRFDDLLRGVTSGNYMRRALTAMRHLKMFYATVRWFGAVKNRPDWPV